MELVICKSSPLVCHLRRNEFCRFVFCSALQEKKKKTRNNHLIWNHKTLAFFLSRCDLLIGTKASALKIHTQTQIRSGAFCVCAFNSHQFCIIITRLWNYLSPNGNSINTDPFCAPKEINIKLDLVNYLHRLC